MVITHEMELLALMGRYATVIDPFGETVATGRLYRGFDCGRRYWFIFLPGQPRYYFESADIADMAGTVIELRPNALVAMRGEA